MLDKGDQPIPGAVVYLKNMKTLAVKSFFAQQDGTYRFPQLALNTDYEIYAEKDGKKSNAKTDQPVRRPLQPTINSANQSEQVDRHLPNDTKRRPPSLAALLRFTKSKLSCFRCWRASTT